MRFHIHFWLAPFFVGAVCLMCSPLVADPAPFALVQHKVGDQRTDIRIVNTKTGRTVWRKRLTGIQDPASISWSPDHRAVAIVDALDSGSHHFRILIWEAGRPVKVIPSLPLSAKQMRLFRTSVRADILDVDSFEQAVLSPDKKRLLLRVSWSQGNATMGMGELWCLTLDSHHLQQIDYNTLDNVRWLSPRKVRYKFMHLSLKSGWSTGYRTARVQ